MISEILSPNNDRALTSDCWHVVHARWSGRSTLEPRFVRSIVSEHTDKPSAVAAARALSSSIAAEMASRTRLTRDQIFVKRPSQRTLVLAKRSVPSSRRPRPA